MKNNECYEVVIIGAAHTDLQLYPAGTDMLNTAPCSVKQMVLTVGGDALNEATVITRLGYKVRLVSCVGDDAIGSLVLEHCRKNNTGTEYIKVDSGKVTSTSIGLIREDGGRTSIDNKSGSIWTFCSEDVERESVSRGRILSFASIFNNPLLDESLVIPLFKRAREKGMSICADTMGCKREEWLEDIQRALSYVDHFFSNYAEAAVITGKKDLEEIAGTLLDCGVRSIIIRIGKRGYFVKNQEEAFIVPAFADTQCLDTTGVRDNFASGFICGLLEGKGLKECAAFVNCTASLSVESVGATTRVRNREQVEARYQEYLKMEG